MEEKVYTQEVVPENPFPGDQIEPVASDTVASGNTVSPTVTKPKAFPVKRTAVELLSDALNTRSKKVLQEFQLQDSGGFKVGDFKEGISGDVRITPNGLTGRNNTGLVTFALDTDGNLVLVGELRSGSTVTGSVIIEENGYILLGSSIFIGDISNV